MGLFDSRRSKPKTRALTAAGQRVVPDTAPTTTSAVNKTDLQAQAWQFRALVPELRFVGGFVATQMSRVRWYAAEAGPDGAEPRKLTGEPPAEGEPEPLVSIATQKIAMDALERLDLNSRGSSMAGRVGENFEYAGECYLLGEEDDKTKQERWSVRSVREIRYGKDKENCPACGQRHYNAELVEPGAKSNTAGRKLPLCQVELYRLWVPDPECYQWADAKITACLGVLDEIVTYDAQARAAAKSRISSGAILFVPEEFSLSRPGSAPVDVATDGAEDDEDLAMEELTSAMLTPISSHTDPSAIVPIIVRGPATVDGQPMKDLIGVVQIPREEIADGIKKREAAVAKLAHGMDIPPEILTGVTEANHWSAWTIDDATVKNHLEPRCEMLADSLTESYLREACLAAGCAPEEVGRLCVWFDATELSQPADPMGIAKDLYDRDELSGDALRRAGGYGDEDAPTDSERLVKMLAGGQVYESSIPIVIALSGMDLEDPKIATALRLAREATQVQRGGPVGQQPRVIDQPQTPRSPGDADASASVQKPDRALPATRQNPENPTGPRVSVTAAARPAAAPLFRVDEQTCRDLGDINQRVLDELGGFIDAQIMRAAEKAATRIQGRERRAGSEGAALFAAAASSGQPVDALAVVAAAGPRFRWSIDDQQALDGMFDKIRNRWLSTVGRAAREIIRLLTKLIGRAPSKDVAAEMQRRAIETWPRLEQAIRETTTKLLHGDTDQEQVDVDDGPILPRDVLNEALTEVGGTPADTADADDQNQPATGLSAGTIVADEVKDAGAAQLGMVWRYRGIERRPFLPHQALSGARLTGFDDDQLRIRPGDEWIGSPFYYPSDHEGCLCSLEIVIAAPNRPDGSPATALPDELWSPQETDRQRETRLLAEADDAAGRTGTDAQRKRDITAELHRLRQEHIEDRKPIRQGAPA